MGALALIRSREGWLAAAAVLDEVVGHIPAIVELGACLFGLLTLDDHVEDTGTDFFGVTMTTLICARCADSTTEEAAQAADVKLALAE